jgi:CHAT domain-containing protein
MLEYIKAKKICSDVLLLIRKLARRPLALWLPLAFAFFSVLSYSGLLGAAQTDGQRLDAGQVASSIKTARDLMKNGHPLEAARILNSALNTARRTNDPAGEARALLSLSGCRIMLFNYRDAQQAAQTARDLAFKINDRTIAGSASINLATIYSQLGAFSLAGKEAARAADLLQNTPEKLRLAQALLIYSNVEADRLRTRIEEERARGDSESERRDIEQIQRNYQRGIDVAHAAGLPLEANLWEELGYSLLLAHRPERAEGPLQRAYILESGSSSRDENALAVNQAHQAELQLQKQNYSLALRLIDQAFASKSFSFSMTPRFYPLHIRGVLLEKLNRENDALVELRRAADAATEWRQGALPGDAISTRTVVVLHEVYEDYAQLAADLSLKTHNADLARDALKVLAENRAANLREEITLALLQKQRLPRRYFDLLSQLQAAQARVTLGENRPEDEAKLEQVRLEVGTVENEFGLKSQRGERNLYKNSLKDIQARLSNNKVLLSFSLGREKSFLWVVTGDRVDVHQLAGEDEITALTKQFSQAVQRRQNTKFLGGRLSQELFGSLPASLWRRPEWLIVADGSLLNGVPFASLPDLTSLSGDKLLADSHYIRFLPSELLLLSTDKVKAQPRFVGVGDPIYNLADSRRQKSTQVQDPSRAATALARLAGSDHEVRAAARQSGMTNSNILTGSEATISSLQKAIAEQPQILHFAVHVVSSNPPARRSLGPSSEAALALSLTKDNMPELLTPEAIATLRVPGSLVILSGCSSQKGEILPGAGLRGLSRAWLLAGASAVIVSSWPTPDDSGRFFSSFYNHFGTISSGSLSERAALALDQAQVEMEHSGGYRSAPQFWAAYSIISKE